MHNMSENTNKFNRSKPDMNERIRILRNESVTTPTTLSIERALIETSFYKQNDGKYSIPMMRAMNFMEICEKKQIYIGDHELIVGERGEKPKAVSTFPELTCHTVEDLRILNSRDQQRYLISEEDIEKYSREVIPYWTGRSQRDRIFNRVPNEWKIAYEAGLFTEFMEQRAPGHTCLDGKIYKKGMIDFKKDIEVSISQLDYFNDPEATDKEEQLRAMSLSCDALIRLGERHAEKAEELAKIEANPQIVEELLEIADVCRWVPAHAPRNFREAIQMYWFVHLGVITELNGWDAFNPGHFDQHLAPFYDADIKNGTLNREDAKELISCFWIKVNNQPAPPKVGVTASESGTYNDFTNINIGGVKPNGTDGVNEVSYIMLEVIEELHILQPGSSVHISSVTPNRFLHAALKVIRRGYGYPSIFNPDVYIQEMLRSGKSLQDAREGGCSGCIEVGAFGKEAYLLTGYLNVPKILEVTLNNGINPVTGKKVGIETGDPTKFSTYDELYEAFHKQLRYVIDLKIRVNQYIDSMYGRYFPATFLSVVTDDCISKGRDYYNGGARYNTTYIQCTGLGTITDSLSALKKHVFEDKTFVMDKLLQAISVDFEGEEVMRQRIINNTPFFGNDNDYADEIAVKVYNDMFELIDGRPNGKEGGKYHMNMLSTTCHNYFGNIMGATPNGRLSRKAISDGTSPSHGADTNGPTAVIRSLGKIDQVKSGGTLLNLRFLPSMLNSDESVAKLGSLVRSYFSLGGHHVQFNIVDNATLIAARKNPEEYRDLMVRVAGYSDYFNDLSDNLKQEIIDRTVNSEF